MFARLLHLYPTPTLDFLHNESIESRPGFKVLLDKWVCPLAILQGKYTKIVTISALEKLFSLKDARIESLLVAGSSSSQAQGNDVYAPLKMFSTFIRCLDKETVCTRKG